MMVIKEEKTWSPILDMDMVKHMILSLLPLYLLELCYGMNSGFTAILTPQLYGQCAEFHISLDQLSWIVSLDNILTPLICVVSGFLQQRLGPLRLLMFACLPYILGWVTASLATSHTALYISRILVGVSNGIVSTSIFTVEICSPELRGTFSMLESVLRCVGSVLIISLGLQLRWWQIASVCPLVPLLALGLSLLVPESPVFSIVQQFSGVSVIRAYSVAIFDTVFSNTSSYSNSTMLSGNSEVCHHTSSMAYFSAIVIGLCRLLASLSLARILMTFSRRTMYFASLVLTILCLFLFSTFSYLISSWEGLVEDVFSLQVASLFSSCLLVISVQLGVQTLPLLLSGELFPADVRATCKGLTRAVTCILLLLSIKLYPQLETNLQLYGTFFMFGAILTTLLPISYIILPETKDISLEHIEQTFRNKPSTKTQEDVIA